MSAKDVRIGKRYRKNRVDSDYDAIVIGSGPGGLSSAVFLANMGQRVLVLEQHYTAGGFSHAYYREGFEWDVGIHYIGAVGNKKSRSGLILDYLTNGELEWAKMSANYDRFFMGDKRYDFVEGKQAFIDKMTEYFPSERDTIIEYLAWVKEANRAVANWSAAKVMPQVVAKGLDWLGRCAIPKKLNRTTWEVLSDLTDNDELKSALTGQWGDMGLPPTQASFIMHSMIAQHYIEGAYYPVGGAHNIAKALIKPIEQAGGAVMTYAEVGKILCDGNRAIGVEMSDGHQIFAKHIISNAGVFNTFEELLDSSAPKSKYYLDKLKGVTRSMASMGAFIGFNETPEQLELPKTNFWIYPSGRFEEDIEAFNRDPENTELPLVYVSFPSAKDPTFSERFPGKATVEIVAATQHSWWQQWQDTTWNDRGEDYEAKKKYWLDRCLEVMYRHLPQLKGKVAFAELATTLSTEYYCKYKEGEIYGLSHDPKRFEQDWLRPKTAIEGLYLTGQDILTCGFMGGIMSGMLTAMSIVGLRKSRHWIKGDLPRANTSSRS